MLRSNFSRLCLTSVLLAGLSACGGSDPASSTKQGAQKMRASADIVAVDYGPTTQQLYIAYFGRPADPYGLLHFKAQLEKLQAPLEMPALELAYSSNGEIKQLVNGFATSVESQTLYTGSTDAFVSAVYKNILARTPPANDEGRAFWVDAIDNRGLTRARAALSIIAGAQKNTSAQGEIDAQVIQSKLAVASRFTSLVAPEVYSGEAAAALARQMLNTVKTPGITGDSYQQQIADLIDQLERNDFSSLFPGTYSGTFDGGESGPFSFTIASNGTINGSGVTKSNVPFIITGTLAKATGATVPIAATFGPFNFTGQLTATGKLSGTWSGNGMNGTVSAVRTQEGDMGSVVVTPAAK
ncbi:DUF4214 domain-containing protein [Massilia sp. SR12]